MAKDAIKYRVGGTIVAILGLLAVLGWSVLRHANDPVTVASAELTGDACGPVQNADACGLIVRTDGGFRSSADVVCTARAEGPEGVLDTREAFRGTMSGGETLERRIALPQMSDAPVGTYWRASCSTS